MKQIIVVRSDLKMNTGKTASQVAHAAMGAILPELNHPNVIEWLEHSFTKIVVSIENEVELLALYEKAKEMNFICCLIKDNGTTVFNGIPTNTCVAIGPDTSERLKEITGHLKLLK